MPLVRRFPVIWLFAVLLLPACSPASDQNAPRADYAAAVAKLEAFIVHEMEDKGLPAVSVVLVDDQDVVWADGFGWEDSARSRPATASTVYRIGSVSKLFTDIGVMQLVERGELDLDAPITAYLPEFTPTSRWSKPITLRQLMAHRSGLVREPPRGHYFDDSEVSLAQTVESLHNTTLVYEPETRTKYSNAGIATVGYVLERVNQEPFATYLKRTVLGPLGMDGSSFAPEPEILSHLATAYMWSYQGSSFVAPTFQLGMAPAGSMYAPVTDLGKFLRAIFAGGIGDRGRVLEEASLGQMLQPQFAAPGATSGYGLGFALGELDAHPSIGHGGAIYGFATQLGALPDAKLGAAAVTTVDGANAVMDRIVDYALRLMLAAREGAPLPEADITEAVSETALASVPGLYRSAQGHVRFVERAGDLFAWAADRRMRIRSLRDTLVVDDRLGFGTRMRAEPNAMIVGETRWVRADDALPDAPRPALVPLLGEYGWDFNTLYIYEDGGQLRALIEWFFDYPLARQNDTVFSFPDRGLYHGEDLVFERSSGQVTAVVAAGVRFPRRDVGAEGTFTIQPVRSVGELRAEAMAATPPDENGSFREPDLVELRNLDPTIAYDIRYATTNNFMQSVFYDEPHAYMQRPAAEALVRAHSALRPLGYGLLIHDAYRPWFVTKMFWDATPDSLRIFVANPASGSRHNRGAAVDLTLYDLESGQPIRMVGGYDEFSDRSFPAYVGGTSRQRWHRELLRKVMEAEGFDVYEFEWWHFDFQDWSSYPISNLRFDQLSFPGGRPSR